VFKRSGRIHVFQYLEFDAPSAKYRVSARYATKTAIRNANGVVLFGTARLALAKSIDREGFVAVLAAV
jgi:hypothetical protein